MLNSDLIKKIKALPWLNYIWLVYIPFNVAVYLPAHNWHDWFWIAMIGLFVLIYIAVVELPHWQYFFMALELLITALFSIVALNNYMIIFPGWQVTFILAQTPRGRKVFRWFLLCYEAIVIVSLIRFSLVVPNGINWQNGEIVGAVFPIISPLMAYFMARKMYADRLMHQTNYRLESVIQRDERERIARDLHDTLGQSFSMITVKTELAKKLLEKSPDKVEDELDDIETTSRQNLQLVRSIVNNLHQQSLSEVLLVQSKTLEAADVAMMTTGEAKAMRWPTAIQTKLAAVLQEVLTNVIRHAHANKVQLDFTETNEGYFVTVQDDGVGKTYSREGSNGIGGMTAQMKQNNGRFNIAANRIGTLVSLQLPKEAIK